MGDLRVDLELPDPPELPTGKQTLDVDNDACNVFFFGRLFSEKTTAIPGARHTHIREYASSFQKVPGFRRGTKLPVCAFNPLSSVIGLQRLFPYFDYVDDNPFSRSSNKFVAVHVKPLF